MNRGDSPPLTRARFACLAGAVFASSLFASQVCAQALEVTPVTIELHPGQRSIALTAVNHDSRTTAVQVRAFAWDQHDGADNLVATNEVAVAPPIVQLPAGATQLIRLVLRKSASKQEATYRLLIDQIPPVDPSQSIRVQLRLSLPVFVLPEGRVAPSLEWRLARTSGGELELVAVNRGQRHARALSMALTGPDGQPIDIRANINPYVLSGAERHWRLAADTAALKPGALLQLTGNTDEGRIEASLVVSP